MPQDIVKSVVIDIIFVTSVWSFVNHPHLQMSTNIDDGRISPIIKMIIGVGLSVYVISKYI